MRIQPITISALVVSLVASSSAGAQAGTRDPARGAAAQERKGELRERLKAMTPEERKAAMERAKEKRSDAKPNLSEAQKAWLKAYNTEQKATRDGIKAGTLTRVTAAAQLKAWRAAHPRPTGSGSGD